MTSRTKISRKQCESKTEIQMDRISNLPDMITNHILSYLTIKDRAKTSILSTKWRYKWATNPILVFDNESLPLLKDDQGNDMIDKLVSNIDRVLSLHCGPISVFRFSCYQVLPPINEVQKWMNHISSHLVRELVLKFTGFKTYELPSSVFSLISLTHLELSNCLLKPPSTFKGFKKMKSLDLSDVKVYKNFISHYPLFEKLHLSYIDVIGADDLNIKAPNLQSFAFHGSCANVILKNTSSIVDFFVHIKEGFTNHSDLVNLLATMPRLEWLFLCQFSFECLVENTNMRRALPVSCANLRYLNITVNFRSPDEILGLHFLLRCAPNLQDLHIRFISYEIFKSDFIWEADQWKRPFNCLRYIDTSNLCGAQSEIDFINFMLLTSPVLTEMVVSISEYSDSFSGFRDKMRYDLMKQLLSFKRASTQAQIISRDPRYGEYY